MALTRPASVAVVPVAVVLLLTACSADDPEPAAAAAPSPTAGAPTTTSTSPEPRGAVEVLYTGLEAPWGLTFLPDGDALVTERDTARVLRLPAGGGEPQVVTTLDQARPAGEGGLLGIAASPDFASDGLVYAYLTAADDNRVVRFRLDDPTAVEPVITRIPKARIHNGGRIAFGPDGHLYVGTGDAGDSSLAQDDRSLGGKLLRATPAGEPVEGRSLVYSKGHRNVQGIAFDDDGRVYTVELGQNRFDEVNQVSQGTNGGWPLVEGDADDDRFLRPVTTWETSEASPSGGAVAGGSLYVAALRGERLWRVPLDGTGGAGEPEALLRGEYGRLRTAEQAPDGALWVLTSNRDGRGDPVDTDDRVVRVPVG